MKRKFIFSEEQIKKFLGEGYGAYLDKNDKGSGMNDSSIEQSSSEIKPVDTSKAKAVTTDKVAAEEIPDYRWFRRSYCTIYESSKKRVNDEGEKVPEKCPKCGCKIGLYLQGEPVYKCCNKECNEYYGTLPFKNKMNERNQYLQGREYSLGKKTNEMIDDISSVNSNDKMLKNMSNDKMSGLSTMYTRLNRIRKMKQEDPERYSKINGKKLENNLSSTIENAKKEGESLKNTSVKDNQFNDKKNIQVKKGHRENPSNITYYEDK